MFGFQKTPLVNRKTYRHCPVDLGYSSLGDASTPSHRIYVTPKGNRYPSITTVLGSLPKDALLAWQKRVGKEEADRVLRHAGIRGSAMHDIAERYINGEEEYFEKNTMPHVKAMFNSIRPVLEQHIDFIFCQELPLYSDHLRVAGRVDLIAKFDDTLSVIDFKTSSRVKDKGDIENYFLQTAAYSIMFEERTGIPVSQLVVIMAVENMKTPLVFIEKRDNWTKNLHDALAYFKTVNIVNQN